MFNKLRNRFLLFNMIVTSLLLLGAFAIVYASTHHNIQVENARKLDSMSGPSLTVRSEGEMPSSSTESAAHVASHANIQAGGDYAPVFTLTVDENNEVTSIVSFMDLPASLYDEAAFVLSGGEDRGTVRLDGKQWLYAISPVEITVIHDDGIRSVHADGSRNISFLDISDSEKTLNDLLTTFTAVGIPMLIVIFFISILYANRSIRPIKHMWHKQRRFIADASHELKTPLSVITANYCALLANENETIISQREWLDYMKSGMDRMGGLIGSLLSLAQTEDMQAKNARFDISKTMHDASIPFEIFLQKKDVSVAWEVPPNIVIFSDETMVTRLFTILYENAVKYAVERSRIEVMLREEKHTIRCSVSNYGPTIPPQDLAKVFDRFFRADPSRSDVVEGYGLGLSIAKSIVDILGGSIHAQSTLEGLTTFVFVLKTC